ncbi:hypothetical protein RvY_13005 [Ramazzottius varieornatus]|uniref:Uncharacterized protein n=1 Tax=Ramazzottius varieornatus TaxID=947166 RepID=A0A1D1VRS7_RAMVA|nr:hypothetical protein RvY_13005 [Ramazzottius varieornatus]
MFVHPSRDPQTFSQISGTTHATSSGNSTRAAMPGKTYKHRILANPVSGSRLLHRMLLHGRSFCWPAHAVQSLGQRTSTCRKHNVFGRVRSHRRHPYHIEETESPKMTPGHGSYAKPTQYYVRQSLPCESTQLCHVMSYESLRYVLPDRQRFSGDAGSPSVLPRMMTCFPTFL